MTGGVGTINGRVVHLEGESGPCKSHVNGRVGGANGTATIGWTHLHSIEGPQKKTCVDLQFSFIHGMSVVSHGWLVHHQPLSYCILRKIDASFIAVNLLVGSIFSIHANQGEEWG